MTRNIDKIGINAETFLQGKETVSRKDVFGVLKQKGIGGEAWDVKVRSNEDKQILTIFGLVSGIVLMAVGATGFALAESLGARITAILAFGGGAMLAQWAPMKLVDLHYAKKEYLDSHINGEQAEALAEDIVTAVGNDAQRRLAFANAQIEHIKQWHGVDQIQELITKTMGPPESNTSSAEESN